MGKSPNKNKNFYSFIKAEDDFINLYSFVP